MDRKYPQLDPRESIKAIGAKVLQRWDEIGLEETMYKPGRKGKKFIFLEGPPGANGRQHVGHTMTRALKDSALRYAYMRGFDVLRRVGGWDCHGLPVEIEAEKHFGFNSKKEIEALGVRDFNAYCRKIVFTYIDEWKEVDRKLGYWVNHEDAYATLNPEYMESDWWAIKRLSEKRLLKKDFKIVPYCPRCGTSLSSHEVAQGYDETSDPSVFVKFRESGSEGRYFLVWTTTPWTLPSNQFLATGSEITYVLCQVKGEQLYLAESLAKTILGDEATIVKKFKGKDLAGLRYDQLVPFLNAPAGSFKVVLGDFVGTDEGTGIVHIAPAFGADDFDVGKRESVNILNPVDSSGKYADPGLPWNGKFVKDADPEIIAYLKKNGSLFKSGKVKHTYPFCYRCKSPLLYYPLDTWFILVSKTRELLSSHNQEINWIPNHLKDGRFGNFLGEAKDWALSRNRYWGTPLPIWSCSKGHYRVVGSRKELKDLSGTDPEDLHRPYIDEVHFRCEKCGENMTREPYTLDTWFDAGCATFAALHYPFEDGFSPDSGLPVDFISEAIDQTRGWFYTLHVLGILLFGKIAFSNCLVNEFVLDEKGRKMSKSIGNVIWAADMLENVGADPVRLFLLNGAPWKPKVIDYKAIDELSRKTFQTLFNVYQFYSSNANLDGYHHSTGGSPENILDRWLLSRLNSLIRDCAREMDLFLAHNALSAMQEFIEELSNFYLRLSRSRFWSGPLTEEKKGSYFALFLAVDAIVKMLAPLTPFFSDYLYTIIDGSKKSVHLEGYPVPDASLIDADLEKSTVAGIEVLEIARRLRQENQIKGRQPVSEILVVSKELLPDKLLDSLIPDLNAKTVRFISTGEAPVKRAAKPVLEKVAPILKSRLRDFQEYVRINSEGICGKLALGESLKFDGVTVTPDMMQIDTVPADGYVRGTGRFVEEVFLNVKIDTDLGYEGLAREIIRRIQVMRKEMNLDYDQKISTEYDTESPEMEKSIEKFAKRISEETLSTHLGRGKSGTSRDWDIDGIRIGIAIEPAKANR